MFHFTHQFEALIAEATLLCRSVRKPARNDNAGLGILESNLPKAEDLLFQPPSLIMASISLLGGNYPIKMGPMQYFVSQKA